MADSMDRSFDVAQAWQYWERSGVVKPIDRSNVALHTYLWRLIRYHWTYSARDLARDASLFTLPDNPTEWLDRVDITEASEGEDDAPPWMRLAHRLLGIAPLAKPIPLSSAELLTLARGASRYRWCVRSKRAHAAALIFCSVPAPSRASAASDPLDNTYQSPLIPTLHPLPSATGGKVPGQDANLHLCLLVDQRGEIGIVDMYAPQTLFVGTVLGIDLVPRVDVRSSMCAVVAATAATDEAAPNSTLDNSDDVEHQWTVMVNDALVMMHLSLADGSESLLTRDHLCRRIVEQLQTHRSMPLFHRQWHPVRTIDEGSHWIEQGVSVSLKPLEVVWFMPEAGAVRQGSHRLMFEWQHEPVANIHLFVSYAALHSPAPSWTTRVCTASHSVAGIGMIHARSLDTSTYASFGELAALIIACPTFAEATAQISILETRYNAVVGLVDTNGRLWTMGDMQRDNGHVQLAVPVNTLRTLTAQLDRASGKSGAQTLGRIVAHLQRANEPSLYLRLGIDPVSVWQHATLGYGANISTATTIVPTIANTIAPLDDNNSDNDSLTNVIEDFGVTDVNWQPTARGATTKCLATLKLKCLPRRRMRRRGGSLVTGTSMPLSATIIAPATTISVTATTLATTTSSTTTTAHESMDDHLTVSDARVAHEALVYLYGHSAPSNEFIVPTIAIHSLSHLTCLLAEAARAPAARQPKAYS